MMQATQAIPLDETTQASLPDDDSMPELKAIAPSLLRADQAHLLYRRLPVAVGLTLLIAAVLSTMLWSGAPSGAMAVWWSALALVSAGRLGLYRAYSRRSDADTEKWLRRFALGALGAGASWGFAGAVFFPSGNDEARVFLAFVMAGMVSGGIPALSAVWQIYALYALALLAPMAYVLVAFGNASYLVLGLLMPFLFLANLASSAELSRTFAAGFRMRRAYRTLAREHTALNAHLDEQLDQLARAHKEVGDSARKLALYIDRAPIAVFEIDEDGTILSANPTAELIFGYPNTAIEGRSLMRSLFAPDQPLLDDGQWRNFIKEGVPLSGCKATCVRRDGVTILCEFSLTPLVGTGGELVSVIVQCQDITRQAEVERLKQEFTSTLSHELRTPLTSILGSLQLINSGTMGEIDPDVSELMYVAERNGQRLLEMINEILDIEKIESGHFELDLQTLRLDELVKDAVLLNGGYAERFKVSLHYAPSPEAVAVVGDQKRLLQVFTNLISNAAKFSPVGGKVEISMRRDGETVRVSVEDRGAGIPPEFRSRIFGRFAQADAALTRKKGGTGLGLAISKRLTELMGGTIGFANREGGGTILHVDLPVAQGDAAGAA